ncbi:MAG: SDR family oxidoreductase [Nitrososphaeria archaeon]|nr:SDR family oxidoreductase [Nitrososphaeria archaeon]
MDLSSFKGFFGGHRILVTGGAGFIGSWLCDALVELGAKVVCLDNLSSGRVDNIKHLLNSGRFEFVNADVSSWCAGEGFDVIVHGASIPSPEDYMSRPVETLLSNSIGLLKLLENARENGSILLYMSTSEVYGDAAIIPTPETYYGYVNPIGLRSCYDESKRFGEALCMAYFRQYNVDVRIARIFNSYGPRLDVNARYARVVPRFILQALRNEPITVHGDGRQTRSFTYITDTVAALVMMLAKDTVRGEVLNVGNPKETSILELAEKIIKLTGSSSKIVFTEPRPDDPRRRCPDIRRAKELIGWEPKVQLEEGLKYTIEWFRKCV